jgi:hypothetical protein
VLLFSVIGIVELLSLGAERLLCPASSRRKEKEHNPEVIFAYIPLART